mgnify:FL=1
MRLPVTPYYERRLSDLRTLFPDTAASTGHLDRYAGGSLMDNLQVVAHQKARRVTRLTVWLGAVVSAGALPSQQAATFVYEAAPLGGPFGVIYE